MTKAHDLLSALGFAVEKGSTTAYPASAEGPNEALRYWATELTSRKEIQFGVQSRSASGHIEPALLGALASWGFLPRDNGREIYRTIAADDPNAMSNARAIIGVLKAYAS
jgi:hypothetical protein